MTDPQFLTKMLPKYLAFAWPDDHPPGAAAIEWIDHLVQTRHPSVWLRSLNYDEDDFGATRVPLDGVRNLVTVSKLLYFVEI